MKQALNIVCRLALILLLLPETGCSNGALIDKNISIDNHNWTYVNKVRFDVNVDDPSVPYNLFMNLRVTGDYKYSNMFVLVTEIGPDKKPATKRFEFTLADKEGQWLGEGSGNLYSFQLSFLKGHQFAAKGLYSFYFEQNMRDNPLREVSDVGLRVEKVAR